MKAPFSNQSPQSHCREAPAARRGRPDPIRGSIPNARCLTSEESAIVEIHSRFRANRDEANSGRLKRDLKRRASTNSDGRDQTRHQRRGCGGADYANGVAQTGGHSGLASQPRVLERSESDEVSADLRDRRLFVRISPEDSLLLKARALARGMRPATYLAVLLRSHLRSLSPLPKDENTSASHPHTRP